MMMTSTTLTIDQLNTIRQGFLDNRSKLITALNINLDMNSEGGDEVDAIQTRQLQSHQNSVFKQNRNLLNRIEGALKRMSEGSYGFCEDCEEPIGAKRLLALPHCTTCIACAETAEMESKRR